MMSIRFPHNASTDEKEGSSNLPLVLSVGLFVTYMLAMLLVILGVIILAGVPMGYVAVKFVPALLITLFLVLSGMGMVCRACYSALRRRQSDPNTPNPRQEINH